MQQTNHDKTKHYLLINEYLVIQNTKKVLNSIPHYPKSESTTT